MKSYDRMNSNRNLILFFGVTLLWTWIAGFIPLVLGISGTLPGTILFYSGGGAPSVVALFLVFTTYSKEARKNYFSRCFSLKRMKLMPTLFALGLFALAALTALLIHGVVLQRELPGMLWLNMTLGKPYLLPIFLFFSLLSGPLNEEFGWRGYSLDRLLVRFGYGASSLILGFVWAIWHLPWYFTPGQAQYDLLQKSLWDAFLFVPSVILLSFVVTFVYIHSYRSILAGAFVHMISNFLTSQLLAPYSADFGTTIRYVNMAFCGIVLIYSLCSKKFQGKTRRTITAIKQEFAQFQKA